MLAGPTQYLTILLPSPTTVSFTVSTRPPSTPRTTALNLLRYTARVLLLFYVLLVNLAKLQPLIGSPRVDAYAELGLRVSLVGSLVSAVAERTEWWILVAVTGLLGYACLRRDYDGTDCLSPPSVIPFHSSILFGYLLGLFPTDRSHVYLSLYLTLEL